jgi:hypothetical protein
MCQFFLLAFSSLIGISTDFRKTVSESDVYLFAGIVAAHLMKWLPR